MTSTPVPANERTPLALADTREPSAVVKLLSGLSMAMLYIAVSASMILFNKSLMKEDRFPFPVFLTMLHMAGSLTMSLLLRYVAPSFFPSASRLFQQAQLPCVTAEQKPPGDILAGLRPLRPFLPIAVCGAFCLVAGNWAYKVATVSFLQMIKESHIVIVYILSLLFGLEQLKLRNALVLLCVACCATLAVSAQASISIMGLGLQIFAGFFGSMQIVMTNVMLSKTGQERIDPMTMVLCVAPLMLAFLLPASFLMWDARIIERLCEYRAYVVFNVLLAFLLQVTSAMTIRNLSGTGMSLASVAKDLGIILAATRILGDQLAWLQVVGFIGSVVFIGIYSAMKLFPQAFESSVAAAKQGP